MPLPLLDDAGFLPPGIHTCTLEEVEARFGRFQSTDQRPRLFHKLQDFVAELRSGQVAVAVIINGSFVTGEEHPNDVDVIVVIPEDFSMLGMLPPFTYKALSADTCGKPTSLTCFSPGEARASNKGMKSFSSR